MAEGKKRTFVYFNPETLAFEDKKLKAKDIFMQLIWFLATAIAFSILVLWIAFYLFDSPKEKMLRRENNELKQQLKTLNYRMNMIDEVLLDVQDRDDEVYRVIFEREPVSKSLRYNDLYGSGSLSSVDATDAAHLMEVMDLRSKQLILRLATQEKSLDTVLRLAQEKEKLLAATPAIRPLKNMYKVTSGFGNRYHPILKVLRPHTGIDITAPKGTPVYATADGIVAQDDAAGSGYGIAVVLNHGYSYQTVYAHLSKKIVKTGQKVKRGQIIGYVGNTGLSVGSHLHYEVIKNGKFVNPVHYFFSDITPEEYEQILESSKEVNQALS
jgi:murein DD-endopeptidase MepM/ murein hydrolase activator NlpD